MTVEAAAAEPNEPFADFARQRLAANFGMWIFLASEMLFFGGLFLAFAVYRMLHPAEMLRAAQETNVVCGTVNALLLHVSSATMSIAEKAGEKGRKGMVLPFLVATAVLGLSFVAVKGLEYAEDLEKGLLPGPGFALGSGPSELFFGFYWTMTGIHAVHLSIGIVAVLLFSWRIHRRRLEFERSASLSTLSLYWHLVDIVWIFLYPTLYLAGRL